MTTTLPKKIATEKGTFEYGVLLASLTDTGTSREVQAFDAKRIAIRVVRTNHGSGSSAFIVEATLNGTDWFTYNMLIDNVANSNVQTLTRVSGKTLSSNSEAQVSMDIQNFPVMAFRVKVTETTDGTHYAEYVLER